MRSTLGTNTACNNQTHAVFFINSSICEDSGEKFCIIFSIISVIQLEIRSIITLHLYFTHIVSYTIQNSIFTIYKYNNNKYIIINY